MSIHSYIVGNLKNDVEEYISKYEELTWIDDFMSNGAKPWFYEYTIQGFIYYNLVRQFDFAAKNKTALFFLEQPYAKTATDNRADIMIVEFNSKSEITSKAAIEIKTDFQYSSIYTDMVVMADHITRKNISVGYGIFFATSEELVNEVISTLKNDRNLKPYFSAHQLYAVGMVAQPE